MCNHYGISAIILAAGTSSRMGRTKQLLPFNQRTLLEYSIELTSKLPFDQIQIVIGHDKTIIQQTILLPDRRCQWVINQEYRKGQSSSLKKGMESLSKNAHHVMVFLADLPFLQLSTIQDVYDKGMDMTKKFAHPFVLRPTFQQIIGHPVFFGNTDFSSFRLLKGDKGAKQMMNKITIKKEIPVQDKGVIWDIDTPEAYDKAIKYNSRDKNSPFL